MTIRPFFQYACAGLLPRPALRECPWQGRKPYASSVIVFGRHPNPTTDYYFAGRFDQREDLGYQLADIRHKDFDHLNPDGALVIICRYTSARVLAWLRQNEHKLSGVVLFLDDDIPAVITGRDASIDYRIFLYYRALCRLPQLTPHLDAVWVSTRKLGESLGGVDFKVVPPSPPAALWDTQKPLESDEPGVLIAYHATSVHRSEHAFLHPIIDRILKTHPHARFEAFADRRAAKLWKGMDRVTIRTPVSWSEYLTESKHRHIDIMLVPLSDSHVNACRSPTKRIDVARFGAAAIFSHSEAYGAESIDGEIILKDDPDLWIRSIDKLITNEAFRAATAMATQEKVILMTASQTVQLTVANGPSARLGAFGW